MRKYFSNKTLVLLGLTIMVAAAFSLFLAQQFSNTLIQFMASQLLEHERQYLSSQLHTSVKSDEHSFDTNNPTHAFAMTPSRAYFTLLHEPLPERATQMTHDHSVWLITPPPSEQPVFATQLIEDDKGNKPVWLHLDINAAFSIHDLLLLLRVISTGVIVLFSGCCAWLIYRLHHSQQLLESTLQREQAFVNDISHELRTPLAIVQNALNSTETLSIANEPLNLAKHACSAMAEQLNVLLALARNKQYTKETLLLLPQLEQAMFTLYQSEPDFISQVKIDVCEDTSITGHPQLIQLLFLNILSNACYHSGGSVLHITAEPDLLRFSNTIVRSSLSAEQPHARHQGFGHGSHLMQRIADALNWTLVVNQSPIEYGVRLEL